MTGSAGPTNYRLAALIAEAQSNLETYVATVETQIDTLITPLQQVATTAQQAIDDSATDRADLHNLIDALTTRVAALEAAQQPPSA